MNNSLKKELKAKAHALRPVILIGHKGLTEAVENETDLALKAHELIKVKIAHQEKAEVQDCVERLCSKLTADCVQIIGNIAVIYRPKDL